MTNNHLLLNRLAELMLEKQNHRLTVDELFDDEQIGDFVRSIQIDSPYQQLLLEGVLTESVRDGNMQVTFTVEGYFHHLLGEVIHSLSTGQNTNYLAGLMENNKMNGITEGVEQCLLRDVDLGDINRLTVLIDTSPSLVKCCRYPLAHAFMRLNPESVFHALLREPSVNDWRLLKEVRGILSTNQKNETVAQIDGIMAQSAILKDTISDLIITGEFQAALELIGLYSDINALDEAHTSYRSLISAVEASEDRELLAVCLERLGESEYRRSGRNGYQEAMNALTKALEIREDPQFRDEEKLKNTYRLLGFAYLSLGLQVIPSGNYFGKCQEIIRSKTGESKELADIDLYLGLVNFWRGLRGIGRWGHADPTLLEGMAQDPFKLAVENFEKAYSWYMKNLGKAHPETLKAVHYLQESTYALGNYEEAIPWLEKYTEALPFKSRAHTDNFYHYCLIVSLEELAKKYAGTNNAEGIRLVKEAIFYAKNYDVNEQITNRLHILMEHLLDSGDPVKKIYSIPIDSLPPLKEARGLFAEWIPTTISVDMKGFQTNHWLYDIGSLWFYQNEQRQLIKLNSELQVIDHLHLDNWPENCNRLVYDPATETFYAWSSIRSTVHVLSRPFSRWQRLSLGVHDVHACGASFGFDPVNRRLFEFGGYGYFTYKNWWWIYDLDQNKWIELVGNKPGITPYPRNGQMMPIEGGSKVLLISGIGSDTGIQREHKARLGLPSATDVGYFTWLRDAHIIDLKTMGWSTLLEANHSSIRHEGAMAHNAKTGNVVNYRGHRPSPKFGQAAIPSDEMSIWNFGTPEGFKKISYNQSAAPASGGTLYDLPGTNKILHLNADQIHLLVLSEQ